MSGRERAHMNGTWKQLAVLLGMALIGAASRVAVAQEIAPPEWGKPFNYLYFGDTLTVPALQNVRALNDGRIDTVVALQGGGEAGSELAFRFPKETSVTMVRFQQTGQGASRYKLLAATTADGDFDTVVTNRTDASVLADQWIELPVNRKVFGLKFVALAGRLGYRSSFPVLRELEMYSPEAINARAPVRGGVAIRNGRFKPLPPLDVRTVDIRVCTDVWNYGLEQWEKEREQTPLKTWHGYRNAVALLQELDVNSVRLFDETLCGKTARLPFASKLLPAERTRDWMRPLTDALKADGYALYYMTHAWKPPFQVEEKMAPMPWCRWDYPYHQSDTLVGINENYKHAYPCVISDDDFRVKWTQMMREALANGAAGVYLMPDEYFFKGHNLSAVNCPSCRREFKKLFGYEDLPKAKKPDKGTNADGQVTMAIPDDTEPFRKWKLFEYTKLAELFATIGRDLRKEFPHAQLVNCENQATFDGGRLEHTIAGDVIWQGSPADLAQVYGNAGLGSAATHIAFMKRFEASAGRDKLLASCGWGAADINRPAETIAGLVAETLLGAKAVEVYRLNYMYMKEGVSVYKRAFRMIRLLEKWGVSEAQVPDLVGLLMNRAGEDWYYTKINPLTAAAASGAKVDFYLHLADESINKVIAAGESDDRQRLLMQERFRGYGARRTMESMLCENGVPYKALWTERPDNMKDLKRFRVLIAPFQYSLSREAFAEIKAAVEAGTKLIVFEQQAPTDEFGVPHEKPLFAELEGNPNVTFVKESLSDNSANRKWQTVQLNLLAKAIEGSGHAFNNNGADIAYLVAALPKDKGFLLYFCNFDPRGGEASRVSFQLPLSGSYRLESYSSDTHELNVNWIEGTETLTADAVAGKPLQVEIAPQEVKLMRIYR